MGRGSSSASTSHNNAELANPQSLKLSHSQHRRKTPTEERAHLLRSLSQKKVSIEYDGPTAQDLARFERRFAYDHSTSRFFVVWIKRSNDWSTSVCQSGRTLCSSHALSAPVLYIACRRSRRRACSTDPCTPRSRSLRFVLRLSCHCKAACQ